MKTKGIAIVGHNDGTTEEVEKAVPEHVQEAVDTRGNVAETPKLPPQVFAQTEVPGKKEQDQQVWLADKVTRAEMIQMVNAGVQAAANPIRQQLAYYMDLFLNMDVILSTLIDKAGITKEEMDAILKAAFEKRQAKEAEQATNKEQVQ